MADQIKKECLWRAAECNVPNDLDMFCEVCGDMWAGIDNTERQEYEAKADEVNMEVANGPALEDIYK